MVGTLWQCPHILSFVSVTEPGKSCWGCGGTRGTGVRKLAYFAGMLLAHCMICQVSPEAQVVQGAQCSSQNLQNQTDPTIACYQKGLCSGSR